MHNRSRRIREGFLPSISSIGLLCSVSSAAAVLFLWRKNLKRMCALEKQLSIVQKQRDDEHAGRIRLEKELQKFVTSKLGMDEGLYLQPIGTIESCFSECLGTPRQGLIAPSSKGRIVLKRDKIGPDALDQLECFSHIWIFFVFHLNTNKSKNARAMSGVRGDSRRHTFAAKLDYTEQLGILKMNPVPANNSLYMITPPMLKKKVGVFATRTPHRPNPVGVTLAKIERVDPRGRVVHLAGLDLVDGTPVLDIKPYVPFYDAPPPPPSSEESGAAAAATAVRTASWIRATIGARRRVRFAPGALAQLEEGGLADKLRFFASGAEFLRAAEDVLAVDVRSRHQTKKAVQEIKTQRLDNLQMEFQTTSEDEVLVVSIRKYVSPHPPPAGAAREEGGKEDKEAMTGEL